MLAKAHTLSTWHAPGPSSGLRTAQALAQSLLLCPAGWAKRGSSPGTPGARQSPQAAQSWPGSGQGPRWHLSRSAAGWHWHSPAAGCICSGPQGHSGPQEAPPASPSPSLAPGLTVSPRCTSHSRHQQRPRSPHRWNTPHTLPPSLGPSGSRDRVQLSGAGSPFPRVAVPLGAGEPEAQHWNRVKSAGSGRGRPCKGQTSRRAGVSPGGMSSGKGSQGQLGQTA